VQNVDKWFRLYNIGNEGVRDKHIPKGLRYLIKEVLGYPWLCPAKFRKMDQVC